MKILVTGGSGLIGKALSQISLTNQKSDNNAQSNTWTFLSSADCNLLDYDKVDELFKISKPDYIIHLAAEVGGLFKNMDQKVKMFENNVLMNFNVIKCAHSNGIQNMMCCLSTCIFPDKVEYPIEENKLHLGPPHDSNYAYAYAKRMLDIHCQTYREQYGRNYFCIVPTNVYGPFDNFNLQDGHVIPALIHQCYIAKRDNTPFYVKGSGKPLRQFIYSLDIAQCIHHLVMLHCDNSHQGNNNQNSSVILSVGEKDEVSIGNVAKMIAKTMDYDNIEFLVGSSDGQYKKTVDNSYLVSIMPSTFSFTPIEVGIQNSVEWFIANYDIARK